MSTEEAFFNKKNKKGKKLRNGKTSAGTDEYFSFKVIRAQETKEYKTSKVNQVGQRILNFKINHVESIIGFRCNTQTKDKLKTA